MPIAPPADIIVTGRALPAGGERAFPAVTIDRERLTLNASGRIETLLADVAGFQSFRRADSRGANPTAQGTVLRGLGGNAAARVLVLLDGVPQGDPFFGSIAFNALVPGELARVGVTRGAGAGPFGLGGVAGVIEIESAGADDLEPLAVGASGGSRRSATAHALAAPRWSGGFATIGARIERDRGFWTTPVAQRGAASVRSAYRDQVLRGRLVTALGEGELQIAGRGFDDRRTLRFRGADSSSSGRDASVRWVRRGRWSVDALAYFQKRDFSTVVVSATSLRPTLDQRATPSTGIGGRFEVRGAIGDGLTLRVGGDVRRSNGRVEEDSLAPSGAVTASRESGGRQIDLGGYGEVDWARGAVALTAGGRIDRWRQSGGVMRFLAPTGTVTSEIRLPATSGWLSSGRIGARVELNPVIAVRGAAYASARLPTLNELYRGFTVFPVTTRANPALTPEKLRGVEAGIMIRPLRGLSVDTTLFANKLADAVANVTIGANLRERRNVAAITSSGVEIEGLWTFSSGRLSASWTSYRARLRDRGALDGKRPAQTPDTAAAVTLVVSPLAALDLSATIRRTGAAFEDDLNIDRLPAATAIDAVARWRITQRIAVEFRAENLANERAVTRNQGGSIDLGVPRTLWLAFVARSGD